MARTIQEIQDGMIATIQSDSTLQNLSSTSSTALWRLITRVVATAIAAFENILDIFKSEINESIATLKPHGLRWYRQKALDFQLGYDLPEDATEYDNTGLDEDEVGDAQVVEYAAVTDLNGTLIVKVNQEVGAAPSPLSSAAYDAFEEYINEVKDAGVEIIVLSTDADSVKITVDVYYDPQILNSSGQRVDGSDNTPIQNAITEYLKEIPYDGKFVKSHLVDHLQQQEGVFVPAVRQVLAARYGNTSFTNVDVTYSPYSGFLKIYDENSDLVLNFIEQSNV